MNETIDSKVPEVVSTPALVPSALWLSTIAPLVEQLELPAEVVTSSLLTAKLVKAPSDKGAAALVDADAISDADFVGAFPGVTTGDLKLAVKKMRLAAVPKAEVVSGTAASASVNMYSLLPQPPNDESLLEALQVGGVAKVGETEVAAAVRVLLADRVHLEGIERRVATVIEERATAMGEPVPEIFYELETLIGRRNYADVLKAMGMPGGLVSAARKKELLHRISGIFGVLKDFQDRITGWQEGWFNRMSNPGALLAGLTAMMGGGGANPATVSLMESPDPGSVIDAAAAVIDQLNVMFAGTGIPVARAMAADAIATRRFLENPALISAVGATSRDEMLKSLGLGVSADLVRAERDVTQYVLCVMRLRNVGTQQLPGFIVATQQLGAQLPWGQLTGVVEGNPTRPNGNGRNITTPAPIPGNNGTRVASRGLPTDEDFVTGARGRGLPRD